VRMKVEQPLSAVKIYVLYYMDIKMIILKDLKIIRSRNIIHNIERNSLKYVKN
jgi:hypothetical protein